jgi:hypothetical protein
MGLRLAVGAGLGDFPPMRFEGWRLRLVNGIRAPLARNRVVDARARGWITEP